MAKPYFLLSPVLLLFLAGTLTNTTLSAQTGSRIKARVSLQGNGVGGAVGDSSVFTYPNNTTKLMDEGKFYTVGSGTPSLSGKDVYTFNIQGQNTLIHRLNWVAVTSSYDTVFRFTYTFSPAGDLLSGFTELKNTGGPGYTPSSRVNYTYNAAHQETKRTSERWRSSGSIWDTSSQMVHEYNVQGKETKYVTRTWSTTTHLMNASDSILYAYDGTGLVVLKDSAYKWVVASATYRPYSRTTNTINASNLVLSSLLESWDVPSGTYKISGRIMNTFDASNRITQALRDSWNATTMAWVPAYRETFSYSAAGDLIGDLSETWSTVSSSYTPTGRQTNAYNSFGQEIVFLFETYNNGVWSLNFGTYSYYESYNELSVPQTASGAQLRLNIAPNPASGAIGVQLQWNAPQEFVVTVTDMTGRIMQRIPGLARKESNLVIDVNEFPAGNYILSVSGNAGSRCSKMFTVRH